MHPERKDKYIYIANLLLLSLEMQPGIGTIKISLVAVMVGKIRPTGNSQAEVRFKSSPALHAAEEVSVG